MKRQTGQVDACGIEKNGDEDIFNYTEYKSNYTEYKSQ